MVREGWEKRRRGSQGHSLTALFLWPGSTASLETTSGSFLEEWPLCSVALTGQSPRAGAASKLWTWRVK